MRVLIRSRTWISVLSLFDLGITVYVAVRIPGGPRVTPSLCVVLTQCLMMLVWPDAALTTWIVCLCGVTLLPLFGEWPGFAGGMAELSLLNLAAARGGRVAATASVVTFADLYAVCMSEHLIPAFSSQTIKLLGWTAIFAGLGAVLRSRRHYVEVVEERARWAMETREAEARRRVTKERLRIARDLHDVLGHHVAVVRLHAGLARRTLRSDPDRAEAALREAESATQIVLREMAVMLRVLREPEHDDPVAPAPGLADIDHLLATLRSGGMAVSVAWDGDVGRVPAVVGMTAYRVVQETLTNARRHGRSPVTLSLRVGDETLTVRTSNPVGPTDPVSSAPSTPGYGLLGMRERVRAAGGSLRVSRDATIFEAVAELPLAAPDDVTGIDTEVVQQ